ncbi:MAG TPA: hypothetical protein VFJ58_04555 [Armatimonadota bacterium]|nr:hypothetical protein [Armatimonadota bacterium]
MTLKLMTVYPQVAEGSYYVRSITAETAAQLVKEASDLESHLDARAAQHLSALTGLNIQPGSSRAWKEDRERVLIVRQIFFPELIWEYYITRYFSSEPHASLFI